jgi:hypothetical protein
MIVASRWKLNSVTASAMALSRGTELGQLAAMGLGAHADLGQGHGIAAGPPGASDAFRALVCRTEGLKRTTWPVLHPERLAKL